MQLIYNLLFSVAKSFKGRFGYAITIKQAVLAAYFAFIIGVFVQLTGMIQLAYLGLSAAFPVAGGLAVEVFPDPAIVAGGVSSYFGLLIFKKATSYSVNAWGAWVRTTHL